jgi:hypothetical protein
LIVFVIIEPLAAMNASDLLLRITNGRTDLLLYGEHRIHPEYKTLRANLVGTRDGAHLHP